MLHEVYRPTDWHEVVGQDKVTGRLARLESAGKLAGKAIWISGRSASGKSSIARIVARKVSRPDLTVELDAGELTAVRLREITATVQGDLDMAACPLIAKSYKPNGGFARCIIVNEAHGLRADTARMLQTVLEAPYLNPGVVWIFTTTLDGQSKFEGTQESGPLLSRCLEFKLAERGVGEAAAARLQWIAQRENLDGQPLEAYLKLFYSSDSNMRKAIGRIEAGEMLA